MANPQPDQYTKISNEILEQIVKYKFNGTQLKIIVTIWRYTYGFQRKDHEMSLSFIAEAIGSTRSVVKKELDYLIEKEVILVTSQASFNATRRIGFNKDYEKWCIPKGVQSTNKDTVSQQDSAQYTNRDTEVYTNRSTKKEKKEIYKENIKESIFETYNNQNIVIHKSLTSKMKQAIDKALKKDSKDNVLEAIKRYGEAFRDKDYQFCKYKMTLDKFLTQNNGYYDWLDEGQKWINYSDFKNKGPIETRPPELKNQSPKIKTKFHLARSRGDKYSAKELEELILNNQKNRKGISSGQAGEEENR